MIGRKFGHLIVVATDNKGTKKHKHWLCLCDCGIEKSISASNLVTGHTKSCGCVNKKLNGLSGTKAYASWSLMLKRCYDPSCNCYERYGGRGIAVCDRWRESFLNFYEDMGERVKGLTLDRIDNNGNYSKENCRWATVQEQCQNRRSSRIIEAFEKKQTLIEWANATGVDSNMILRRLASGWTIENALLKPVIRRTFQRVTAFGRTQLVSEWAKETGISDGVIRGRLRWGWDPEDALSIKANPKNKNYKTIKLLLLVSKS